MNATFKTAPSDFLKWQLDFTKGRALQSSTVLSIPRTSQRISGLKRLMDTAIKCFWVLLYRLLLSLFLLLEATADLYGSLLWEVIMSSCRQGKYSANTLEHKITWLSFALAWGTVRVFRDRNHTANFYDWWINGSGDATPGGALVGVNVWGFGQVFAVTLLLLPFLSFSEIVYGCLPLP